MAHFKEVIDKMREEKEGKEVKERKENSRYIPTTSPSENQSIQLVNNQKSKRDNGKESR